MTEYYFNNIVEDDVLRCEAKAGKVDVHLEGDDDYFWTIEHQEDIAPTLVCILSHVYERRVDTAGYPLSLAFVRSLHARIFRNYFDGVEALANDLNKHLLPNASYSLTPPKMCQGDEGLRHYIGDLWV